MSMISVRMMSLVYIRLEPLLSVVAGDDRSRYVQDQFVIRCQGDIVVSFSDFNFWHVQRNMQEMGISLRNISELIVILPFIVDIDISM